MTSITDRPLTSYLLLPVRTGVFHYFGRNFHIFPGHWQDPGPLAGARGTLRFRGTHWTLLCLSAAKVISSDTKYAINENPSTDGTPRQTINITLSVSVKRCRLKGILISFV